MSARIIISESSNDETHINKVLTKQAAVADVAGAVAGGDTVTAATVTEIKAQLNALLAVLRLSEIINS